jgi:DnaJ-class molecular chaperone
MSRKHHDSERDYFEQSDEKHNEECGNCGGSGMTDCPMEWGDDNCPPECPACGGSSKVVCPDCQGAGTIEA